MGRSWKREREGVSTLTPRIEEGAKKIESP